MSTAQNLELAINININLFPWCIVEFNYTEIHIILLYTNFYRFTIFRKGF